MDTREEILTALSGHRIALKKFGVKEMGIFGSFARNEQRPESDVDVLVKLSSHTFDEYMDVLFFLEDLFGRKVDLVEKDTIKPLIRNRVLRETVYVPDI